jgi:hypothetical protein
MRVLIAVTSLFVVSAGLAASVRIFSYAISKYLILPSHCMCFGFTSLKFTGKYVNVIATNCWDRDCR